MVASAGASETVVSIGCSVMHMMALLPSPLVKGKKRLLPREYLSWSDV